MPAERLITIKKLFVASSLSLTHYRLIAVYCFFEKKPAIDVCFIKDRLFVLF